MLGCIDFTIDLADPDKMPKIKAELEKQPFKGKLHDLQVDTQGVRVEEK